MRLMISPPLPLALLVTVEDREAPLAPHRCLLRAAVGAVQRTVVCARSCQVGSLEGERLLAVLDCDTVPSLVFVEGNALAKESVELWFRL